MTTFIRGESPVWFWVNTVGQLVDDTYYAFFLTNDLPYLPQNVYQDPNGINAWSNPIEFQSNAGLPDNLYFNPSLVYRIEIRKGPTQSDPLIGNPIQNYIPGSGGGGSSISDYLTINPNIISNPQFSDIVFTSPYTFSQSTPGTYTVNVGAGWQLVLTGFGSVTLTQNALAGDNNNPENPPYSLTVNSSGTWSSVQLVQKLQNNGALFANGAMAVSFEAFATTNAQQVTVVYDPITGTSQNLFQGSVATGGLATYTGYADIVASTNALTGTSAYVNILITLPNVGVVTLTNIQITGQSTPLSDAFIENPSVPLFQEQSYNQIVNNEFYLYRDPLKFKPIPSYLVGWDFPLNPAQFLGDTVATQAIGAGKSFYAWDQTIVFQSVNSGVSVQRAAYGELQLTAALTGQMAIIQYLPLVVARKALNNPLCVNLSALTNVVGGLQGTVSLYYTKDVSLPDLKASNYNSIVATLDANGKPATFNGNWIEVPYTPGFHGTFTIPTFSASTRFAEIPLSGWDLGGAADGQLATFMAIVVGFKSITAGPTGTVGINSISLQAGSIPTIPAPQSQDEVLRACQYYYEQSYNAGVVPGTVTTVGMNSAPAFVYVDGSGNDFLFARSFYVRFEQQKRTAPLFNIYSPATGALHQLSAGIWQNNANPSPSSGTNPRDYATSNFNGSANNSLSGIFLLATSNASVSMPNNSILEILTGTPTLAGDEGIMQYHYVADARLGIV